MSKLFDFDLNIIKNENKSLICGIDEVGRGCLAGPVFSTAIIMSYEKCIEGVNDSKKLTPKKREIVFDEIMKNATDISTTGISNGDIDKYGILKCTINSMKENIEKLKANPDLILVDYIDLSPEYECGRYNFRDIVHGDTVSYAIAAASIVAKVTRDKSMCDLSKEYPQYHFEKNKGYGTAEHIAAIREFGPCPVHRMTFIKNLFWIPSIYYI